MTLNHINLTVSGVPETRAFLEKHFGLRPLPGTADHKNFAVLLDDKGLVLTLISAAKGTEVKYPQSFHIGFAQESEERVNEINRRLKQDGFDVQPPGRAHGSWTFYFQAPGGFTIEVLA